MSALDFNPAMNYPTQNKVFEGRTLTSSAEAHFSEMTIGYNQFSGYNQKDYQFVACKLLLLPGLVLFTLSGCLHTSSI